MGKNNQNVPKGSKLEIVKNLNPGVCDRYFVYLIEPGPHKYLIAGFRYRRNALLFIDAFMVRYRLGGQ